MQVSNSPSVLIVRLDAIGDALALAPLIAALRESGAKVDGVLRPQNANALATRALDTVHLAEFPLRDSSSATRRAIGTLAERLAARHYDYALVATEDLAGYRLASASRAKHRIGFYNGWGKPLKSCWTKIHCTRMVFRTAGLDARGRHECEVLFDLGRDLTQEPRPTQDTRRLRPLVIDSEPAPDDRVLIQISDKWKRIGVDCFELAALAQALRGKHALRFAGAAAEREYVQNFSQVAQVQVETFEATGPWKEAIAAAKAIVAPDSGALHVAGMAGTPTVAIFPEIDYELQAARWAPWAAPYRLVKRVEGWKVNAALALEDLLRCTSASERV